MNSTERVKFFISMATIIIFVCLISAGWVIAQSTQQPAGAVKENMTPGKDANLTTPATVQKYFGEVGRPDPFIIIKTGRQALSAGPESLGKQSEGPSEGMILTGIFFANGDRYALIKSGGQSFALKEGQEKFGYRVSRITNKKVTVASKAGSMDLQLEEYAFSVKDKLGAPLTPGLPADGGSLVPPPMQAPVPFGAQPGSSQNQSENTQQTTGGQIQYEVKN